ncbi:MAG: OmpA family protein [Sphingomonas sp.]|nr:OmpA family protein [Sphingomonas sp.]
MRLNDAARAQIDTLLETPAMQAGGAITLRGHSDSRGSDGDNLVASRKRAEAVAAYLTAHGVAADRIAVIALGETRPIAPNANLDGTDNPDGRAKNRRVDIVVDPPAAPAPAPGASPGAVASDPVPDPAR